MVHQEHYNTEQKQNIRECVKTVPCTMVMVRWSISNSDLADLISGLLKFPFNLPLLEHDISIPQRQI